MVNAVPDWNQKRTGPILRRTLHVVVGAAGNEPAQFDCFELLKNMG